MVTLQPIKTMRTQTLTTDGPGNSIAVQGSQILSYGDTFDGASVSLELSLDEGSTWRPVPESEQTEPVVVSTAVLPRCLIRPVVSDAGGSTSVVLQIRNANQ